MKKCSIKRFLSLILACVLVTGGISITASAAEPRALWDISFSRACAHCGDTDLIYLTNSVHEQEWTEYNCPNTPETHYPHTHLILYYCSDYRCTSCGNITSVVNSSEYYCAVSNMPRTTEVGRSV